MNANNLSMPGLDIYLQQIFQVQSKLIEMDAKIALLQFELQLEKQMTELLRKYRL